MRLEPIDLRHPGTVALLQGPLVLMAIKPDVEAPLPTVKRAALLAAERTSVTTWQAKTAEGPLVLAPFTELGERPYATYLDPVF
jgi:hypothetical protein